MTMRDKAREYAKDVIYCDAEAAGDDRPIWEPFECLPQSSLDAIEDDLTDAFYRFAQSLA